MKEGKTDFPIIEDGGVAAKDGKVIAVGTAADVQQFITCLLYTSRCV